MRETVKWRIFSLFKCLAIYLYQFNAKLTQFIVSLDYVSRFGSVSSAANVFEHFIKTPFQTVCHSFIHSCHLYSKLTQFIRIECFCAKLKLSWKRGNLIKNFMTRCCCYRSNILQEIPILYCRIFIFYSFICYVFCFISKQEKMLEKVLWQTIVAATRATKSETFLM